MSDKSVFIGSKARNVINYTLRKLVVLSKKEERQITNMYINRAARNIRKDLKQMKSENLIVNYGPVKINRKNNSVSISYSPVVPCEHIKIQSAVEIRS